MKTLSLARPLMLILVGLPGAGKSFFARQFAEMFGAPIVSADRLLFELFAQPKYSQEETELIQRLADYQIGELLKTHRSFVVDGGSNARPERQKLEKLAQASGYGTLTIWVQTDETTCRQRATKRNPKRVDDQWRPSMREPQWVELAKHFAQPSREPYMVISGKHAFSTQAKMVLRKLTAPHIEEAETAHQQQEHTTAPQRQTTVPDRPLRPRDNGPTPQRRSVVIS